MEPGRLILPHIHIMRKSKDEGPERTTVSGVLLPHLIENMISAGALEILITDKWRYQNEFHDVLMQLPSAVKKYVKIIEPNPRINLISDEIFNPVLEEIGIENIESGSVYGWKRDPIDDEENLVRKVTMNAHSDFPRFLEALFLKAQFHFDIQLLLRNLEIIRAYSKSAENRITIASLSAILASYKTEEIAAGTIIPSASKSQSVRLMDLLLSYEFRALSQSHSLLGRYTNIPHIVSQIQHQTMKLLKKGGAKGLIGYATKMATVASGVPIPTTDLAESLLNESFLPPTLDMSDEILRAKNGFVSKNLEFKSSEYIGL